MSHPPEDEFNEYFKKLQKQDSKTWDLFDAMLRARIGQYLTGWGFSYDDAMDIYQEVILRFVKRLDNLNFENRPQMMSYIYTICDNRKRTHYRKLKTNQIVDY